MQCKYSKEHLVRDSRLFQHHTQYSHYSPKAAANLFFSQYSLKDVILIPSYICQVSKVSIVKVDKRVTHISRSNNPGFIPLITKLKRKQNV